MHPARPRLAPFWPRRILLVGGDSVVSRALLVFLRKEGFDAAIVSDDPGAWGAELAGRPFATDRDTPYVDAVLVSPHISGVDASVAWPFRLREVLGMVESLTGRAPRAESA